MAAAALVVAFALGSSEDPVAPTPPAEAAPAPAKAKKASPPAKPAADRPPAAVAGYTDLGPGVLGTLEGSSGAAGAPSSRRTADAAGNGGDSLPFTGLDLTLLALAGAALLGVGVGLRRISSQRL